MRLPIEIVDDILLRGSVRIAIVLRRAHVVRKLMYGRKVHQATSLEHAQWLRRTKIGGEWARDAYLSWATEGYLVGIRWLHEHCIDLLDEFDHEMAIHSSVIQQHLDVVQCIGDSGYVHANALPKAATLPTDTITRYLLSKVDDTDMIREALNSAMESGRLNNAKLLRVRLNDDDLPEFLIDDYVSLGNLDLIRFLHFELNASCTTDAMDFAAACDSDPEMLRFLHENRTEGCTTDAMDFAAEHGNLEAVKYLAEHRTEGCTESAMILAAGHGDIEIIRYLHEKCRVQVQSVRPINAATENGHLSVVRYLLEISDLVCVPCALDNAAEMGHLDVIQFFTETRFAPCTKQAMDWAAGNGHLAVVQYLSERRSEGCTTAAMNSAAENGFLSVVKYLNENRKEGCTTNAMDNAAVFDHYDIVKYLGDHRTEGCTTRAINYASSSYTATGSGSSTSSFFDIIRYLDQRYNKGFGDHAPVNAGYRGDKLAMEYILDRREFKSPVIRDAIVAAVRNSHIDLVQCLHERYPAKRCTISAMASICSTGNMAMLEYLHKANLLWQIDSTFGQSVLAARLGHLDAIRYLHEHNLATFTTECIDNAAERGHISVIRFLLENRKEGFTHLAIDRAAPQHPRIVQMLITQYGGICSARALEQSLSSDASFPLARFIYENQPHLHDKGIIGGMIASRLFSSNLQPESITHRYLRSQFNKL